MMARTASDQRRAIVNDRVVAMNDALLADFTREYLNNGLAVFDRDGKRFGFVTDCDRPGGCFVVHLTDAGVSLCIPLGFVRRVRRGKVYISARVRDLTRGCVAAPTAGTESSDHGFKRSFGRLFRLLAFGQASV